MPESQWLMEVVRNIAWRLTILCGVDESGRITCSSTMHVTRREALFTRFGSAPRCDSRAARPLHPTRSLTTTLHKPSLQSPLVMDMHEEDDMDVVLALTTEQRIERAVQKLPTLAAHEVPTEDSCPICLVPFSTILEGEANGLQQVELAGVTKLYGCGHVFCRLECVLLFRFSPWEY